MDLNYVLGGGLEPPRLAAYAPQTYVSAISPPERYGGGQFVARTNFPASDSWQGRPQNHASSRGVPDRMGHMRHIGPMCRLSWRNNSNFDSFAGPGVFERSGPILQGELVGDDFVYLEFAVFEIR